MEIKVDVMADSGKGKLNFLADSYIDGSDARVMIPCLFVS